MQAAWVNRLSSERAVEAMQSGEITGHRPIMAGYNSTFLVEIANGEAAHLGVYKPRRGETPLWDFPSNTLYIREHLAWAVSAALDWDLVPPTIIREGPYGVGSVQLFVHAERGRHYFNLVEEHKADMVRMAVLDILINNADRKGGHVLKDNTGGIRGIDHGLSFLSENKLRTVMWDIEDEPIGDDVKDDVAAAAEDEALLATLERHLSPSEVDSFYHRCRCVIESATLPLRDFADAWRPYPWPAI